MRQNRSAQTASVRLTGVFFALIIFTAVLFKNPAKFSHFRYEHVTRWSGPWENPNTFGIFMAVGIVLLTGLGVSVFCKPYVRKAVHRRQLIYGVSCLTVALLEMICLWHSYSRGAWLAFAVGAFYLSWRFLMLRYRDGQSRRCGTYYAYFIIVVSLGILTIQNCKKAGPAAVRRASSLADINDFSWRNRVLAWEGTLQMMAENPFFGVGWNQPEAYYGQYYRQSKIRDAQAIQMNDYFVIGASIGIPALLSLFGYIANALSFVNDGNDKIVELSRGTALFDDLLTLSWNKDILRAASLTFAVSFWFDGGLLTLSTAGPFWIFLEMSGC